MRIFTLGKNGIPLFLFALILFSGTYSSYGQQESCPGVTDQNTEADGNQQYFCDSQQSELNDLLISGDVTFFTDSSYTETLDSTTLLQGGTTYHVEVDGCRTAIAVTIFSQPQILGVEGDALNRKPEAATKQSLGTLDICVSDVNDPNIFVSDLITNVPEGEVQWYRSTTATGTPQPIADPTTEELQNNNYYYAARLYNDPFNAELNCETNRSRTRILLTALEAPEASAEQEFCAIDEPTLADIAASGDNRYYATADSQVELSQNRPLQDGETYYVAALGESCESEERTAVTVTVTPAIVENSTQRFCESIGTGNDFRQPQVQDLSPAGTWYADEEMTTPLGADEDLIDGNVYYTSTEEENCVVLAVTGEFFPTPNAGSTSQATFCESEEAVNLVDYIAESQLGPPDQTGYFTPALSTGTNMFNPQDYAPGDYSFTYTVEGNEDCPTDTSVITVTVQEGPNAGIDVNETICSSELEDEEGLLARFSSYLEGRDQNGTFTNSTLPELYARYLISPVGTFSTTYTVTDEATGCTDTAILSVTVVESPDAGEDATVDLPEGATEEVDLLDALGGSPDAGGTWSNGNGTFDPTTDTPGAFTYTVTANGCTDTATVTVTMATTEDCPVVTAPEQRFCASIGSGDDFRRPNVSDLEPATATWYATADASQALAPTTDLVDGATYFAGNANGTCEDRATVTVEIFDTPNAGRTSQAAFCSNEPAVNLVDYIAESILGAPQQTGYFTPALENNTFNPADYAPGTYEFIYTVEGNEDCPTDTSVITVTVNEAPNAGDDAIVELTEDATEPVDLFAALGGSPDADGTWSNGDGTFDPTTDTPGAFTYTVTANGCTDTATVTVTMMLTEDCPEVTDTTQEFCESIGVGDSFRRPRISDLAPANATWYASADSDVALAPATRLQDGAVYYAGNTEGTCENRSAVTVEIFPTPNAGRTSQVAFCSNEAAVNLVDYIAESILGAPQQTGYFRPALENNTFNPADYAPGTHRFTYIVEGNEDCPTDEAVITVTIRQAPDAGEDATVEITEDTTEPIDLFAALGGSPVAGGTWDNGNGTFNPTTDSPGVFTYSVTANGCTDTATVRVTTMLTEDCPEVTDTNQEFCESIGAGNNSRRPRISDLTPANATWYASADSDEALAATAPLQNGAVYYAGNAEGTCENRAAVTVTIFPTPNAGRTSQATFCSSEDAVNLVDYIAESVIGAPQQTGYFTPALENNMFNPADHAPGSYSFTYTVEGNEDCPTDTSVITVTVLEGPDAGEDGSITLNMTDDAVNLFDSLGGTPDEGGTWNPGGADGILNPADYQPGTYNFTYTVTSDNNCTDTATVSVTIEGDIVECPEVTATEQTFCETIGTGNNFRRPTVSDLQPANASWYASAEAQEALPSDTILEDGTTYFAGNPNGTCEAREMVNVTVDDSPNAGATTTVTFCENGDTVDLVDYMNPSILGDPDRGGTFSPALASGTTIFDPAVDAAGRYTYRVESENEACPADTAVITITLTQAATAGEDVSLSFCASEGPQDLFQFLPEGVATNGSFSDLEGGMFDPSANGAGEYSFDYTVETTGECEGTSTATYTITVEETPDAPEATDLTFCVVEGAIVADLDATGENIQWYTDETLQAPANDEDLLVDGAYYATQTTAGGCESAATMITVTLNDAAAPTLVQDGNVFCEFDRATIAELEENINETGTITWYSEETGGTPLSSSDLLQDGTTYYASLTDATTACESSQRLEVTVTLEMCEVVVPEAFSPNGDFINDTFEIPNLVEQYPNYTIEIYNRWGNVVFQGNASTGFWDGVSTESRTLGDKVLPVGVYFYILNFNDGETAPTQGRLYLSR